MKKSLFSLLCSGLLLIGCQNEEIIQSETFYKKYEVLNTDTFNENEKFLCDSNGLVPRLVNGKLYLYNLGADSVLYKFNMTDGVMNNYKFNISTDPEKIQAIYYNYDITYVITNNQLYEYVMSVGELRPLAKIRSWFGEHVVKNIYDESLYKYNKGFTFQLDKKTANQKKTQPDYMFATIFDTSFAYAGTFPQHYKTRFRFFNAFTYLMRDSLSGHIGMTDSVMYLYNSESRKGYKTSIEDYRFIAFDTARINDQDYIKNYTREANVNWRLLFTSDYIYLLRSGGEQQKDSQKINYELHKYSKELQFIDKNELDFELDPRLVIASGDSLIFMNTAEKSIYVIKDKKENIQE